nr:unnamed protein product [Callosobruchus chinensis]
MLMAIRCLLILFIKQSIYGRLGRENGPEGARYNRTKQGWIDGATFEDWFSTHLLPVIKNKKVQKLSSGIILVRIVLKLYEENDIKFICLPPNSSHLTQPLDLAYFRPLKIKWRQFSLNGNNQRVAGFKKAGIHPISKDEVLKRLPSSSASVNLELVGETSFNT